MKKQRSDRQLADDIVALLDSGEDKRRHPDMTIKSLLQRARDAGDGPLRKQYIAEAQQQIAKLDQARHGKLISQLQGEVLALQGRGGDTEVAHVTPGEVVVPKSLQTSELIAELCAAAREQGIDLQRLIIGNRRNSINPNTGQPEFYDDNGEEIEGITVTTPREHGLVQLPQNLPDSGYYNYGTPANGAAQYGVPAAMGVIGATGSQWHNTGAAPFGVGNMSLKDGSKYDNHGKDHMTGMGIDIRPIRNDEKQGPITSWRNDPAYDREGTQQLVDSLNATGGVTRIFFNDPQIKGVVPFKGHDNHLHATVDPTWKRQ